MQSAPKTHRQFPLAPIVSLTSSLLLTVLALLLNGFYPTLTWGVIAVIVVIISFLRQWFVVLGLALGIVSVWLNAPLPYAQGFSNCTYQAHLILPNYASTQSSKAVYLAAKDIDCKTHRLPNQTLQLWDSKGQFADSESHAFTITSALEPVRSRLNFAEFDYEKHLVGAGIRLTIKRPQITATHPLHQPIVRLRNAFFEAIINNLSPDNATIVVALVTGNRSGLSSLQTQVMQHTGSSHILAISGLHLALLGGVGWLLGQWCWACSWRLSRYVMPIQAGAIVALLTITAYALLTGFDVPVKRAWVMFSLLIVSWLWLKSVSPNALLLAAVAVVMIEPYAVVSVGFYFSFIATFIVLWCVRMPYPALVQVLCMQLLINLTLLPITWFVFGSISASALLVNVLIIPWLGIWVLPWAVLACLLTIAAPTLASPVWTVVDFTTSAMWQSIDLFHQLGWSFSPRVTPTLPAVIVAVGSLLLALIYKRVWLALGFLMIIVPIRWPSTPTLMIADGRYTSALIDNGKTAIIINAGRRYRHINQAKKWHRQLQQRGVELGAIVLQDEKLSNISATQWLRQRYPTAKIITLKPFPTPFPSQYCQGFQVTGLQLSAHQQRGGCSARITWGKAHIDLFQPASQQAILNHSSLRWQGTTYSTKDVGAIRISPQQSGWQLTSTRQQRRLWRAKQD